jgi:hypothetical protein
MQINLTNQRAGIMSVFIALLMMLSFNVLADEKKLYTENEFLDSFSGKPQKVFMEQIGDPVKKSSSVKPSGATGFMTKVGAGKEDQSKPVKVEMWYYNNIVTYDGKRTYKEIEITFVNERAMNIAFFNNK